MKAPQFHSSNQKNVKENTEIAKQAIKLYEAGNAKALRELKLTPSPKLQSFVHDLIEKLEGAAKAKAAAKCFTYRFECWMSLGSQKPVIRQKKAFAESEAAAIAEIVEKYRGMGWEVHQMFRTN